MTTIRPYQLDLYLCQDSKCFRFEKQLPICVNCPHDPAGKKLLNKCTCLRCGHSWYPRSPKIPKFCASCNSPYWAVMRSQPVSEGCPAAKKEVNNLNQPSPAQ